MIRGVRSGRWGREAGSFSWQHCVTLTAVMFCWGSANSTNSVSLRHIQVSSLFIDCLWFKGMNKFEIEVMRFPGVSVRKGRYCIKMLIQWGLDSLPQPRWALLTNTSVRTQVFRHGTRRFFVASYKTAECYNTIDTY